MSEEEKLKKENKRLKGALLLIKKYCIDNFDINDIDDDIADELEKDLDNVFELIDLALGEDE